MSQPTQAQRDARARNWRVRRVRAYHAQSGVLDPDLAERVRGIADEQLRRLGAETETERRERRERLQQAVAAACWRERAGFGTVAEET